MNRSDRLEARHVAVAALLVAIFMAQSLAASRQKSPVFDEPPHIASGLSYVDTHTFNANRQHPPLLKELSALALKMAGVHWPHTADAETVIRGGPTAEERVWSVGIDIIAGGNADRTLFWARLPFVLLGALLGALIYLWGRDLVGPIPALGGLLLFAFDPTILAHTALVTTDVGVTTFVVLFLFTLWRYLQHPSWPRVVWCGLALGGALGAKFSAIFLVPTAAILLFVARERRTAPAEVAVPKTDARRRRQMRAAAESQAKSVLVLQRAKALAPSAAFAVMCGLAAFVIEALYFFPRDPFLYLAGLRQVNADHAAGFQAFLHGQLASRFYSYFAAAFLLKEPLATIALTLVGLIALFQRQRFTALQRWFLLLTPAVLFLAVTLFADDLGIRYLIPTLPFAHLLGGVGLTSLWELRTPWGRPLAVALCAWVLVEAAGIYPDHLAYFNEAACLLESPSQVGWDGGSRCGPKWLDDSNVDWGQGLKQLRAWIDRNAPGRIVKLAYFGVFPPEDYGLRVESIGEEALMTKPTPGLYAVSAHGVARMAAEAAAIPWAGETWLQRLSPVAIVGHAYYIYDVK